MSTPQHTHGLPGQLEQETYDVLLPLVRKYADMHAGQLSLDRIMAIMDGALHRAYADVYQSTRGQT